MRAVNEGKEINDGGRHGELIETEKGRCTHGPCRVLGCGRVLLFVGTSPTLHAAQRRRRQQRRRHVFISNVGRRPACVRRSARLRAAAVGANGARVSPSAAGRCSSCRRRRREERRRGVLGSQPRAAVVAVSCSPCFPLPMCRHRDTTTPRHHGGSWMESSSWRARIGALILLILVVLLVAGIEARVARMLAAPRAFVANVVSPVRHAWLHARSAVAPAALRPGDLVAFNTGFLRPLGETWHSVAIVVAPGVVACMRRSRVALERFEDKVKASLQRRGVPVVARRLVLPSATHADRAAVRQRIHEAASVRRDQRQRLDLASFARAAVLRAYGLHTNGGDADLRLGFDSSRGARRAGIVCSTLVLNILCDAGVLDLEVLAAQPLRSPDELVFADVHAGVPPRQQWDMPWSAAAPVSGAFWTLPCHVDMAATASIPSPANATATPSSLSEEVS
jgi:hypothetical protein